MKLSKILSLYLQSLRIPQVRQKLLVTLLILVLFRLVAHIPVPGVNVYSLSAFFSSNQFLSLLDIFSGGTLANFSVAALGLNPYINASVIIQIYGLIDPRIQALQKEGEYGRQKVSQYTKIITIPVAIIQSVGMYGILKSQNIVSSLPLVMIIAFILSMVAGTMIMIFLADLINDYGIESGTSVLIFAGIVSRLPFSFLQTFRVSDLSDPQFLTNILIFSAMALVLIASVVYIEEAILKIPVSYAKTSQTTFLPIKVDTTGVMPIIFAMSLVSIPSLLGQFLSQTKNFSQVGKYISTLLQPGSVVYIVLYFIAVVAFTFFYTSVVFKPKEIADELRKSGAFIPGVRPGVSTENRLKYLIDRIIVIGAIFLGLLAILPSIIQRLTNISTLTLGGTSILIVVSVIIELSRKLENAVESYNYDQFI